MTMNIWTNGSFGTSYCCSLSQIFTFQENVEEIDSKLRSVKCYFFDQKIQNCFKPGIPLETIDRKRVKNYLKLGFVPTLKDNTYSFEATSPNIASSQDWVLSCFERAIQQLSLLVQRAKLDYPKTLCCPIVLDLFEDPVTDNHGCTFERRAIEMHLKNDINCPLTRQPIDSLVPNRSIKDLIDKMKQKPLIPLLPCMMGKEMVEDQMKADRNFEIANIYEMDGDYTDALETYVKAFAYTNRSEDYEAIPRLFIKKEEPLKAALAYIYLAMRQIQEGKSALESLEKSLQLAPNEKAILIIKAFYLLFKKKLQEAGLTFFILADLTKKQEPQEAILYWERALNCDPLNIELYAKIICHVDDETKVRLLLIAFSHFYKDDLAFARKFYEDAVALQPKNPMIYLALLSRLPKQDQERVKLYHILADIFIENQEQEKAIHCFDKVLVNEKEPMEIQKYIDYLMKVGNQEKAQEVALHYFDLLYTTGEGGISEAMKRFGRATPFLEKLLGIYVNENNLKGLEELIPELAAHYVNQTSSLERIYRLAHDKISQFESSFKLGQILVQLDKTTESLRIYYDLSMHAYTRREFDKVSRCLEEIMKLNGVALLTVHEQQILSMQTYTVELFRQLAENNKALKIMQQQNVQSFQTMQEVQNSNLQLCQQLIVSNNAFQQKIETKFEILDKKIDVLQNQFDPDKFGIALNSKGKNADLIRAAEIGDIAKTKVLIVRGADVNAVSPSDEDTPLACAVKNGRLEIAELLILNGALVNLPIIIANMTEREIVKAIEVQQPLALAIQGDNLEMVKLLLRYKGQLMQCSVSGYQRDATTSTYYNHIHLAVKAKSFRVLDYLLSTLKATYWTQDVNGQETMRCDVYIALVAAVHLKSIEATEQLLKKEFITLMAEEPVDCEHLYGVADYEFMLILQSRGIMLHKWSRKVMENAVKSSSLEAVHFLMRVFANKSEHGPKIELLEMTISNAKFQIIELLMKPSYLTEWQCEIHDIILKTLDWALDKSNAQLPVDQRLQTIKWLCQEKQISLKDIVLIDAKNQSHSISRYAENRGGTTEMLELLRSWGAVTLGPLKEIRTLSLEGKGPCVNLLPLSDGLLACFFHKTLKLFDPKTGDCLHTSENLEEFDIHENRLIELSEGTLAIGSHKTIKLWDPKTRTWCTIEHGSESVSILLQLQDGTLASVCNNSIVLWDHKQKKRLRELRHSDYIWSLTQLSNGILASGSRDGTVKLWDTKIGTCLRTLNSKALAFMEQLSDGTLVCSGGGTIEIWNPNMGTRLHTIQGRYPRRLFDDTLAMVQGKTITIWDAKKGICLRTIEEETREFTPLRDGTFVTSPNDYHDHFKLWNPKTGDLLRTFKTYYIQRLKQLRDGTLVGLQGDGTIKLWS